VADRLYLSYWLRGFNEANMQRHFATMLRKFPMSRLRPAMELQIYDAEFVEPSVFASLYDDLNQFDQMMEDAKRYRGDRFGYEVSASWDLWQWDGTDWKVTPARVSLECFGPLFERDRGEDLRIEFGVEDQFLPQLETSGNSLPMVQSNIRSLLKLTRDLDAALLVEKRQLWSESGENFADRLQSALTMPDGPGAGFPSN
jgi:hypothetical protein